MNLTPYRSRSSGAHRYRFSSLFCHPFCRSFSLSESLCLPHLSLHSLLFSHTSCSCWILGSQGTGRLLHVNRIKTVCLESFVGSLLKSKNPSFSKERARGFASRLQELRGGKLARRARWSSLPLLFLSLRRFLLAALSLNAVALVMTLLCRFFEYFTPYYL